MKISYRTHPLLEKIYKGTLYVNNELLYFDSDTEFMNSPLAKSFISLWEYLIPEFKKEVNHLSESYMNAYYKSIPSILKMISDQIDSDDFNENAPENHIVGTIILIDSIITVSLDLKSQNINGHVFGFDKSGAPLFFVMIQDNKHCSWFSNTYQTIPTVTDVVSFIWGLALFKKYAAIDTVIVKPFSKKKPYNIKCVNDTKLEICYLDSKWYTNIIRTESFGVRGHFRLQPFGKGRTLKKTIWIEDFKKSGYSLHARKEAS